MKRVLIIAISAVALAQSGGIQQIRHGSGIDVWKFQDGDNTCYLAETTYYTLTMSCVKTR